MTAITWPPTGETVKHMACPLCTVEWSFTPPRWLGAPWPRSTAEDVFAGHMRQVHSGSTPSGGPS